MTENGREWGIADGAGDVAELMPGMDVAEVGAAVDVSPVGVLPSPVPGEGH